MHSQGLWSSESLLSQEAQKIHSEFLDGSFANHIFTITEGTMFISEELFY
jgi:hypothetical protein